MFLLGQVFLTSLLSEYHSNLLTWSCVENCFVMKDPHWRIEQHLIKSMFVFCLMSSLLFLVLSYLEVIENSNCGVLTKK